MNIMSFNYVSLSCDQSTRWNEEIKGKTLVLHLNRWSNQSTFKSVIEKKLNGDEDRFFMSELMVVAKHPSYQNVIISYDLGQETTKLNQIFIKKIKTCLVAGGNLFLVIPAQNHLEQFARLLYEYGEVVECLKGSRTLKKQLQYYFQEVKCHHIEWQQHYKQVEDIMHEMIEVYSPLLLHPSFDLEAFKLFIEDRLQKTGPLIVNRHYLIFKCIHRIT
ncbi:MAG TPA: hypothetical protein DCY20_06875 [Firmicutes bacterium]|nr:hypothetical protein [Bacillota bacterium]